MLRDMILGPVNDLLRVVYLRWYYEGFLHALLLCAILWVVWRLWTARGGA